MGRLLGRLGRDCGGASAVEYAIFVALVSLGILVGLSMSGVNVSGALLRIATALNVPGAGGESATSESPAAAALRARFGLGANATASDILNSGGCMDHSTTDDAKRCVTHLLRNLEPSPLAFLAQIGVTGAQINDPRGGWVADQAANNACNAYSGERQGACQMNAREAIENVRGQTNSQNNWANTNQYAYVLKN